jgi:biopolymer transport protein ExbB/TolQ
MDFSLGHLWASMGLFAKAIVVVMAFMSTVSLIVMFERIIVFSKSRSESMQFAEKMSRLLSGGDLAAASQANLGKTVGHLGRVINSGLTAYRTAPKDHDAAIESVTRALERQAAREVQSFKRGLGVLATVGSTAPFIGLLGTVMGIVNSFQMMAASGSGGLGTVSAGIAEALITTAFGLLVAIPAVMAFNFLQGWVDARSVDISESSNEFLDLVAKHYAQG